MLHGESGGGGAIGQIKLEQDVGDVALDRVFAQTVAICDRGVRQAMGEASENLLLSRTEFGQLRAPL